jgi:hypothetical protein
LWQVLTTSNGTFKIFNAYYDTRADFRIIRILAFINRVDPAVKTFCQLKFRELVEPVIVETFEYRLIWHREWGSNTKGSQPNLIACKNPLVDLIPSNVSIVEHPCDEAKNNLQIIYNIPNNTVKQNVSFAVCVKDLDFIDDQSKWISEWLEIQELLGAKKVFIYVIKLHPNVMKVLKFYEKRGLVNVEMMTEPNGLPNKDESLLQWFQNELISLNDCLYKHMYEYDYLSPFDIDEVLMPKRENEKTWQDLMRRFHQNPKKYSAYVARNVFFLLDNIHANESQSEAPRDFNFLKQVYRAKNFSMPGVGAKSFHDTQKVISMHNHFPIDCIGQDYCDYTYISIEDAQLQHYRKGCGGGYSKKVCDDFRRNTVKDLTLWKFKNEIVKKVNETMETLKKFTP